MTVSYKKLWKLLIDKDLMKKDLRAMTGVSTTTMSRLSKGENVSTEILAKICTVLNCDVGDIMEFVPDSSAEGSNHQTGITTEQKAEKGITYENFTYHGEKRSNGEQ